MDKTTLLDYSKGVLLRDSISTIIKSHINIYKLDIEEEESEQLVNRFLEIHEKYIYDTFEQLNFEVFETDIGRVIKLNDNMQKIASVVVSKLAVELILLKLLEKINIVND